MPQHSAERLCLSGEGSLTKFEAAPRTSAAQPQINKISATVSQRLTALCCGKATQSRARSSWQSIEHDERAIRKHFLRREMR